MSAMQITTKSIQSVTRELLGKAGVEEKSIDIILDTILFANKTGNATHGVGRLPLYLRKIEAGHLNPKDEVEVLSDTGAVAVLDANNGFGQVAAHHAIETACDKAEEYGVSALGVRNSNNFGMAGYFGNTVAMRGYAAIIFANAAPAIAPPGGNRAIFGTNPMCYSFPGTESVYPITLDMATTVAARGKIRLAAKNGEKIPTDWAVGPDGLPTDDPNEALKGTLLPIGGYKGYGLSAFIDIFAGLLTGSAFAGDVKNLGNMEYDSGNGHLFVVIDVKRFMTEEQLSERVQFFHNAVKSCGEAGTVLIPGEREWISYNNHNSAVDMSAKQVEEINAICCEMGAEGRLEHVG